MYLETLLFSSFFFFSRSREKFLCKEMRKNYIYISRQRYISLGISTGFIFARNYFLISSSKRKEINNRRIEVIYPGGMESVQIFVSFLPRAEVQSRFPAESTEIIKSISGLETRQLEEWFYRRMTKFFILLFLSSLSLSFFFLIFRGKSRRYPGEFLFRVSKTWLRLPAN